MHEALGVVLVLAKWVIQFHLLRLGHAVDIIMHTLPRIRHQIPKPNASIPLDFQRLEDFI